MGTARTTYTAPPTQNPVAYGWNPFQSNITISQPVFGGNPTFTYGNVGASPSNTQASTSTTPARPKLHFLATLNLPDLSKLMNDPVRHDPLWPPVPTKLPSDIPKFEGKVGEDPGDHATTFHLWCSSNSLNEDSVRLRLFQRTLTGTAAKWYIELPPAAFSSFWDLATAFLIHFQFPVRYDFGTDLLSSFRQNKETHISDHIQEWRRRKSLIKATIPPEFLLEWFLKSLLPYISKDVSTSGVTSEEEAILRAQQLDLIYSQSGILYEIIPEAPRPSHEAGKPKPGPHADGVVGSVTSPTVESLTKQLHQLSVKQSTVEEAKAAPSPQNANVFAQTSQKGNQQPGEKKKKGKR